MAWVTVGKMVNRKSQNVHFNAYGLNKYEVKFHVMCYAVWRKNDRWKKLAVFALCTYNVENAKFPA